MRLRIEGYYLNLKKPKKVKQDEEDEDLEGVNLLSIFLDKNFVYDIRELETIALEPTDLVRKQGCLLGNQDVHGFVNTLRPFGLFFVETQKAIKLKKLIEAGRTITRL
jgi:hypothetical protein